MERSRLAQSATSPVFATAMSAAVTLLLAAGCGSNADTSPPSVTPSSAVEVALPSPAEVEQKIARATDPDLPPSEKISLVEGSESDPQLFDDITRLQAENPAEVTVLEVKPGDSPHSAIALTQVEQNGEEPTETEALIVYIEDEWQLSARFVCGLISNSQFELPEACDP